MRPSRALWRVRNSCTTLRAKTRKPGGGDWRTGALPSDSLPDRVEISVVRFFLQNPGTTLRDIETAVNAELPGLLTPSQGLLRAVLASYAIEVDGNWSLRPEDSPSARRVDLEAAGQVLAGLAPRLGFTLRAPGKSPAAYPVAGVRRPSLCLLPCWPPPCRAQSCVRTLSA